MNTQETKKLAGHIMRLLKVRSVSFPIAITDKGPFSIKYIGDADYEMVLDAVPLPTKHALDDDNNIELKAVLEKYWFSKEEKKETFTVSNIIPHTNIADAKIEGNTLILPKKRGRPAGTKNKVK